MKVNVDEPIINPFNRKQFQLEGREATLGSIMIQALLGSYQVELDPPDYSDKCARFKLAQRINSAVETVELNPKELVSIKRLVGLYCVPVVVGVVDSFLAPPNPLVLVEDEKSNT